MTRNDGKVREITCGYEKGVDGINTSSTSGTWFHPELQRRQLTWIAEICVGPGTDDSACSMSLAPGGKQVIGALE